MPKTPPAGLWNASIVAGKAEIPFKFELQRNGDLWQGSFFEGSRKIASTSGSYSGGTLQLRFENLNAVLTATYDGAQWTGTYRYNRKNSREYPFHATPYATPAFASSPSVPLAGEWEMRQVSSDPSAAADPRNVLSWR
ncbi:MAG: hypothetical protein K6U02_11435, partial [Firmicutes bacterium]|nr:hypothetical protein [Bacillota bacterium]